MAEKVEKIEKVLANALLVEDGHNPRFDFEGEQDLINSIRENGVIQPLRVYKDEKQFIIIDGERRFRAIRAGQDGGVLSKTLSVPVIVMPKPTKTNALITSLLSNDGKPLLPLEEAYAYKRLKDEKMSEDQIAKKIGRSTNHVINRLRLVEATPETKKALKEGKIGTTVATEILRKAKSAKEEKELVKEATSGPKGKEAVKKDLNIGQPKAKELKKEVKQLKREKAEMVSGGEGKIPDPKRMVDLFETLADSTDDVDGLVSKICSQLKNKPILIQARFTVLCRKWFKMKYNKEVDL